MEMSNREIALDYKNAAFPKKQIKILAELNCTDCGEIRRILRSEGIEVPEPKKRKKKEEPEEPEEAEEPVKEEPEEEEEEERTMAAVLEEKQKLPDSVKSILFKRIDELEKIIQDASKEYRELTTFMEGVVNE